LYAFQKLLNIKQFEFRGITSKSGSIEITEKITQKWVFIRISKKKSNMKIGQNFDPVQNVNLNPDCKKF